MEETIDIDSLCLRKNHPQSKLSKRLVQRTKTTAHRFLTDHSPSLHLRDGPMAQLSCVRVVQLETGAVPRHGPGSARWEWQERRP